MAMPPDSIKRPIGPPSQGAGRPANPNLVQAKKPLGKVPYGKKPPIKGAIKRPGPPPSGSHQSSTHHHPQQLPQTPMGGQQPERGRIAPPPPLKAPSVPPPPPMKPSFSPPPPTRPLSEQPLTEPQAEIEDDNYDIEPESSQEESRSQDNAVVAASPFTVSKEQPVSYEKADDFEGFSEKGRYDNNFAADLNLPPVVLKTKVMIFIFIVLFASGLFAGKFFGQTGSTVVSQGLQGVVENPEVPRGRLRCGIAEKGQGCVLYLVNSERREVEARDFYSLAGKLTGVQEFLIQTGNMRYANMRIRPGHFAQINIPPIQ